MSTPISLFPLKRRSRGRAGAGAAVVHGGARQPPMDINTDAVAVALPDINSTALAGQDAKGGGGGRGGVRAEGGLSVCTPLSHQDPEKKRFSDLFLCKVPDQNAFFDKQLKPPWNPNRHAIRRRRKAAAEKPENDAFFQIYKKLQATP